MAASSRGTSSSSSRARKPSGADALGQAVARAAVEVAAPERGRERRRAPRSEARDDAGEHVARAGGAEARPAALVRERRACRPQRRTWWRRQRPSGRPARAARPGPTRAGASAPSRAASSLRVRRQHRAAAERLEQRGLVGDGVDGGGIEHQARVPRRLEHGPHVGADGDGSPSSPGPTSTASAPASASRRLRGEVGRQAPVGRSPRRRSRAPPCSATACARAALAAQATCSLPAPARSAASPARIAAPGGLARAADHQHAAARLLVVRVVHAGSGCRGEHAVVDVRRAQPRATGASGARGHARALVAERPRRRCTRPAGTGGGGSPSGRGRRSSASSSRAPSRGRSP